jgi:hypothetical protein
VYVNVRKTLVQWIGKVADVRGPDIFVCVTAGKDRNATSIV